MSDMPSLGAAPQKNNQLVTVSIAAGIFGLMVGAGYWLMNHGNAPNQATPTEMAAADAGAKGEQIGEAAPSNLAPAIVAEAPAAVPSAPVVAGAPAVAPVPAAPVAAAKPESGVKTMSAIINGPLESAIVSATNKETGTALTQVVTRTLVWWVAVPGDLLKGDSIDVEYETRADQEPLVHAVRFTSRKFGKTFEAYRFKAPGAAFAKFYQPDGAELEERLVDGPLDTYEQITSLLRDGRKHKGVDFKTSVGTPVKATFTGKVVRRNWNFRSNGNSLEVEESGGQGRTAIFLHLADIPKGIKVGDTVTRGTEIATSGNTGHSFAPHLHYQLMKGTKVIDPFKSHKTERASISADQRSALDKEILRLRNTMPQSGAASL